MTGTSKTSRTALIIIAILSLAVAGAVAALGVHLARNRFERYPPAAEAGFLTQCEQSGSSQFCGCVLHAIEKTYTYKEFSAFADEFSKSGALPQGAVEALGSCSR
jgi:hypothetical protein